MEMKKRKIVVGVGLWLAVTASLLAVALALVGLVVLPLFGLLLHYHDVSSTASPGPVPVISDVRAEATSVGVEAKWTTDVWSTSYVIYGTTENYGLVSQPNDTLLTSHQVLLNVLNGLEPGTTYHYRVVSKGSGGLESRSSDYTFTYSWTGPPGPVQVISDVSAQSTSGGGVEIKWTTDMPSTSQVVYGRVKNGSWEGYVFASQFDETLLTSHRVLLNGLEAGTTYYYSVASLGAYGEPIESGDYTFTYNGVAGP